VLTIKDCSNDGISRVGYIVTRQHFLTLVRPSTRSMCNMWVLWL